MVPGPPEPVARMVSEDGSTSSENHTSPEYDPLIDATPRVTVSANVLAAVGVSTSHPGITADSTAGSVTAAQTRSGDAWSTEDPEIFIRSILPLPRLQSVPVRRPSPPPNRRRIHGAGRTTGSGSAAWRRSENPWRPRPRTRSPPPPESHPPRRHP